MLRASTAGGDVGLERVGGVVGQVLGRYWKVPANVILFGTPFATDAWESDDSVASASSRAAAPISLLLECAYLNLSHQEHDLVGAFVSIFGPRQAPLRERSGGTVCLFPIEVVAGTWLQRVSAEGDAPAGCVRRYSAQSDVAGGIHPVLVRLVRLLASKSAERLEALPGGVRHSGTRRKMQANHIHSFGIDGRQGIRKCYAPIGPIIWSQFLAIGTSNANLSD
mmetsp:Transcript_20072/g.56906  ORF Transcript_20072/g.56906 Transcript_20072/m.56906 type:complete len:223 (-) Transcript_20072:1778-2446(-)